MTRARAGWPETLALCAVVLIFAMVAPMCGNPVGWLTGASHPTPNTTEIE